MVSDEEIAAALKIVFGEWCRKEDLDIMDYVRLVETKLGLDLAEKIDFIDEELDRLLRLLFLDEPSATGSIDDHIRSHPPEDQCATRCFDDHIDHFLQSPEDHFVPQYNSDFQNTNEPQFPPHFQYNQRPEDVNFPSSPHSLQTLMPPPHLELQPQATPQVTTAKSIGEDAASNATALPQKSRKARKRGRGIRSEKSPARVPVGRKGKTGICGVSAALRPIFGGLTALPRKQVLKRIWKYIRANNLQDPTNKKMIISDAAFYEVVKTDRIDMCQMMKPFYKHLRKLEASKSRLANSATDITEPNPPMVISEALAKFFGTGLREMTKSEALHGVMDHIKANGLEDPTDSMMIRCDTKLEQLFGCEVINVSNISDLLVRYHLSKP